MLVQCLQRREDHLPRGIRSAVDRADDNGVGLLAAQHFRGCDVDVDVLGFGRELGSVKCARGRLPRGECGGLSSPLLRLIHARSVGDSSRVTSVGIDVEFAPALTDVNTMSVQLSPGVTL